MMLCAKYGWNWPSSSWEEEISSMYFRDFVIISPWKRVWSFISTKWNPLQPKDALCQVWLKLTQRFWRRRFLNFVNIFSLFRNYLPLERGVGLHLNKLESTSPKDALCQVWLKFEKCEKFTDRRTDDMRSENLTWAFSPGELKITIFC